MAGNLHGALEEPDAGMSVFLRKNRLSPHCGGERRFSLMDGVMLVKERGGVYWPETSMERWRSRTQE